MSRQIITASNAPETSRAFGNLAGQDVRLQGAHEQQPNPEKEDKYSDRLVKYIPAEVVALYVGVTAIVAGSGNAPHFLNWAIFVICLIGTFVYLRVPPQNVTSWTQLCISTVAFAVWAFALGGPFADLSWYKPVFGEVLLPIFTFFVGLIKPPPQA